jgi:hypothetical protein
MVTLMWCRPSSYTIFSTKVVYDFVKILILKEVCYILSMSNNFVISTYFIVK